MHGHTPQPEAQMIFVHNLREGTMQRNKTILRHFFSQPGIAYQAQRDRVHHALVLFDPPPKLKIVGLHTSSLTCLYAGCGGCERKFYKIVT